MRHDIIVIGAGHNGLTAACYLVRAGLDVLVVEAASSAGGMTSTAPIIPAAPNHCINLGALDATFIHATNIVSDLGLERFGYRQIWVDPIWVCLATGDESIAIWRDARRTAEEIRKFSAADAEAYLQLIRTLDALIDIGLPLMTAHPLHPGIRPISKAAGAAWRQRKELLNLGAMLASSCAEVIDSRFRHPVVRDALAALCASFGPILADGTAVILLALGWYLRYGAARPVGGTQAYPNALLSAFEAMGGQIRCSSPVDQVIVDGKRATGVRLASGEEIHASKAVLAACDPRAALLALLPPQTLNPEMEARASAIPAFASNTSMFKVDIALSGRLNLSRYERRRGDGVDLRKPGAYMGTLNDAIAAEAAAARGEVPQVINLYANIPTAVDQSQAPEGQDTLWMLAHPMPLRPLIPWAEQKQHIGAAIVARATEFFDGIEQFEIGRSIESNEDLSTRFRASSLWHVDLALTRLGPLRPAWGLAGYRTPIDGFYLGSAGSHPMPGISSLPGRLASAEILRSLGAR